MTAVPVDSVDSANAGPWASSWGPRGRRVLLTALTGAALSGFYGLYALVVNPIVSPPQIARPGEPIMPPAPPPPMQGVQMAKRFLGSQKWCADAKYILRTEKAFIYFEDWEPLDDDRAVRFEPFAMVYLPEGRVTDEQPYTVVSHSAHVRFAKPFDITDPDPGRVIGGALEGETDIHGPDNMHLAGRNFQFSEQAMQIWCDGQVRFRHGPHHGTGRGLQVALIPDPEARAQEKLAVKGFRSVRLRRNVSMDLEFRGRPDRPDPRVSGPQPSTLNPQPDEPTIVKVRSGGSFEFDVETNVATFQEEVRVYQPTGPEEYNSLQADRLALFFQPVEGQESGVGGQESGVSTPQTDAPRSPGEFQSVSSKLEFHRLEAEGRQVVLRSERNEMTVTMARLDYDATSRVAKLRAARPERGETVRVLQRRSEMHAPEIELLHLEGGDVDKVWCRGAGWLTNREKDSEDVEFSARWQRELRKYPDPAGELDVIELHGLVQITQPQQQFGLAADVITLWLEPQERDDSATVASRSAQSAEGDTRMRPKRMLAIGHEDPATPETEYRVALVSREMWASTKRLEAYFEPTPPPGIQPAPLLGQRSRRGLRFAVQQVNYQAEQPAGPPVEAPAPDAVSNTAPVAASAGDGEPVMVKQSDLIRATILQDAGRGSKTHVAEVWVTGDVQIEQRHAGDEKPLVIDGDKLHVVNPGRDEATKNHQVMTVYGSPAHVRDRGMTLEGRTIFLDRAKNESRVEGAGLLQLPVRQGLEGEKLAEERLLDILWSEQMTFDGEAARFFGEVRAVLDDSSLRCAEMEVRLTERVDFAADRGLNRTDRPRRPGPDAGAEIGLVICDGNVEFDSYQYEDRVVTEIRHGELARFELNQQTGDTRGQGPGRITSWQRGRSRLPGSRVRANEAAKSKTAGWEYRRIDFAGVTEGNVQRREQTFHDRVRIIFGPVERPPHTIELDHMTEESGWLQCESLTVTQHRPRAGGGSGPPDDGYITFLAEGNAEAEGLSAQGHTFQGRADSISYDQSKDLYTLHSDAPRVAEIWRQKMVGGEMSRAEARQFLFIPSRNVLKSDGTTGLDGVQ